MERGTTTSYAGRQVDLELLAPVESPGLVYVAGKVQRLSGPVDPETGFGGRLLSGVEKVAQRYARLFLTAAGSVKSNPERGTNMLPLVMSGQVSNMSSLEHLCAVANATAVLIMRHDDADRSYGSVPDDERLERASIVGVSLERSGGSPYAAVTVRLTTAAGEGCDFVVPVEAGLSA